MTTPSYIHKNTPIEINGECISGSTVFDKNSSRFLISIYWENKRYRIFRHPITGAPFFSKKSAEKQLNKIRTEIDEGYFNPKAWFPDSPLSVKKYTDNWLGSSDVTKKTLKNYKGYCKNFIIPFFGEKDIRTIRYTDILKFKKYVSENLAPKTVYNILSAFKTMMRFAWKAEDIYKLVPFPELSMNLPGEIEYLSMEKQDKVLNHIPDNDRAIFAFMMDNGTRIGEGRALMKDRIKEKHIIIDMTFSDNDLKPCSDNKKGGLIGLTKYTGDLLKNIPENFSNFVFTRDDGKPYTNKNLNKIWRQACKKENIKIKLYNAVRHSLGCQLLDMGIDIDIVRQQLRHTNIKMTQRYAQRSNNLVTDVLDRRRADIIPLPKRGVE